MVAWVYTPPISTLCPVCGGIALDSLSHHRHGGGVVVCHNNLREVSMIAVVAISVREWKCAMVDLNKDHNQIHMQWWADLLH